MRSSADRGGRGKVISGHPSQLRTRPLLPSASEDSRRRLIFCQSTRGSLPRPSHNASSAGYRGLCGETTGRTPPLPSSGRGDSTAQSSYHRRRRRFLNPSAEVKLLFSTSLVGALSSTVQTWIGILTMNALNELRYNELRYYVIYGHGSVPTGTAFRTILQCPANVNIVFYCSRGQTTVEQTGDCTYPKLWNRLTVGSTLPTNCVREHVTPGNYYECLFLSPFEHSAALVVRMERSQNGLSSVWTCEVIEHTPLFKLITDIIVPNAVGWQDIDIHWLACRHDSGEAAGFMVLDNP